MFQITNTDLFKIPTFSGNWVRVAIIKETLGKFREFWFFVEVETQERYLEERIGNKLEFIEDSKLHQELSNLVEAAGLNKLIVPEVK